MSRGFETSSQRSAVRSQKKPATIARLAFFILFTACYPLSTDVHAARPLVTEDAIVAGKGITQFEAGIDYTKERNTGEGTTLQLSPIHGATEDTEISLKLPYIFGRPTDPSNVEGWGDISFVIKQLLNEESETTPAALVKMAIKLPTGNRDKGLGTGDTNVGFLGAFTKNRGRSTIHLNIGFTFVGDQKEKYNDKNQVNFAIAGEHDIGKRARVVGEVYGLYYPDYKAAEIERRVLLGVNYRLNDTLTFDCAAKRGLEGFSHEYGIIAGATIAF